MEEHSGTHGRGKFTRTDLGGIIVISKGDRDLVLLRRTHQKVFVLRCPPGRASQLLLAQKSYLLDQSEWDAVWHEFSNWKRRTSPSFKLPQFSGRRRDGQPHPWSYHAHKARKQEPPRQGT